jgi:hypothetical protein
MPHRSDRWHLLVRLMAPVRPVDSTSQASGNQQMHNKVPGSLSDSSRPWNKTHHQITTYQEGKPLTKPSKTARNEPRTGQQGNRTTPHEHTTRAQHHKRLVSIRPVKSTGQTGHAWATWDEQQPQVNSPKSNSQSPESLHGFAQDNSVDSRNTSWPLHSQDLVHQNLLNQDELRKSHQELL